MRRAAFVAAPVALFGASRMVVFVALWVAPILSPGYRRGDLFFDWDASHYLNIAEYGYPPLYPPGGGYRAESAFFPLLPWLARWVDAVTPFSLRGSALVVSHLTALAAVIGVAFLAKRTLGDDRKAMAAVALVAFWPASYVFSMFYSDALLVALAAGCLLALRDERWLLAGVAALLASAARPNGIALAVPCAWVALMAARKQRSLRPFVAPALAPLGMLGYFVFLWVRLDDFFLWFKAEEKGWGGGFDFGRHFVSDLIVKGFAHPTERFDLLLSGIAGLVAIGLLVWAIADRLPVEQVLYAAVILVLALGAGFGASVPRYVLSAFPLLFTPARRLGPTAVAASTSVLAGGLALLTLIAATTRLITP